MRITGKIGQFAQNTLYKQIAKTPNYSIPKGMLEGGEKISSRDTRNILSYVKSLSAGKAFMESLKLFAKRIFQGLKKFIK